MASWMAHYDCVPRRPIVDRVHAIKVPRKLLRFVRGCLADRYTQVRLGGVLSKESSTSLGVLKGSVLSPILFNVAMTGVQMETRSVYADDVCIWFSGQQHS